MLNICFTGNKFVRNFSLRISLWIPYDSYLIIWHIWLSTDFGQLYSSSEIVYNVNRRYRLILIVYYKRKVLDTYHITHVKSEPFPDPQMIFFWILYLNKGCNFSNNILDKELVWHFIWPFTVKLKKEWFNLNLGF